MPRLPRPKPQLVDSRIASPPELAETAPEVPPEVPTEAPPAKVGCINCNQSVPVVTVPPPADGYPVEAYCVGIGDQQICWPPSQTGLAAAWGYASGSGLPFDHCRTTLTQPPAAWGG